jgi:hypothetical protein
MANRHKFQKGGRVAYAGGASNVAKEAEEKATGGAVVARKDGGKVSGHKAKRRYARGGSVGADKHPFSSAHRG